MKFSIFTKPWKHIPFESLCQKISAWGFDGVEFPLRDGYQAQPRTAERDLPALAKTAAHYGLSIMSVASSTDENIFAACEAAQVPLIRIMAGVDPAKGYMESERDLIRYLDGLTPLCEKYNVRVGVQNHCGHMVFSTMELRRLLEGFDPAHICAVWDAAHSGLAGEQADRALDIIWDKLWLVNLKNAFWKRASGPESPKTLWEPYFTLGRFGMASYEDILRCLTRRGYTSDICFPAEFTDSSLTDDLVPLEMAYVKEIMPTLDGLPDA